MKHSDINRGILRAHLDGELDPVQVAPVEEHLKSCAVCQKEVQALSEHAGFAREALGRLPELPESDNVAIAWAKFQKERDDAQEAEHSPWALWKKLSLAATGLAAVAVVLALTVAPVRAWAESLLAIFRVQHFTVLELNPRSSTSGGQNEMLNQTVSHMLSDEVTITQKPQKPQLVADAATATRLAGFPVQLLSGASPTGLVYESGVAVQMKLDQDRLQSILDEAGRSDLKIPPSVDGAVVGVRIPAGVMAFYGNCGDRAAQLTGSPSDTGSDDKDADSTCTTLMELPSPTVSAPAEINPAQIAQVVLQFLGMNANDAASFTQTVDWTSTLVVPIDRVRMSYQEVHVNGNDGALLRAKHQEQSGEFTLMWVDDGILHALNGTGDDTTAINLASQLQ